MVVPSTAKVSLVLGPHLTYQTRNAFCLFSHLYMECECHGVVVELRADLSNHNSFFSPLMMIFTMYSDICKPRTMYTWLVLKLESIITYPWRPLSLCFVFSEPWGSLSLGTWSMFANFMFPLPHCLALEIPQLFSPLYINLYSLNFLNTTIEPPFPLRYVHLTQGSQWILETKIGAKPSICCFSYAYTLMINFKLYIKHSKTWAVITKNYIKPF